MKKPLSMFWGTMIYGYPREKIEENFAGAMGYPMIDHIADWFSGKYESFYIESLEAEPGCSHHLVYHQDSVKTNSVFGQVTQRGIFIEEAFKSFSIREFRKEEDLKDLFEEFLKIIHPGIDNQSREAVGWWVI